jgi:circadian clock protein KaiB
MNSNGSDGSNGSPRKVPPFPHCGERYVLKLFVTGSTARSLRAITNIKRICERHLAGRYNLEVIDVYQRPRLARAEQIVAAPTLVKVLPLPLRKLIGDLADTDRTLIGLGLEPAGPAQTD